MKRVGLLAGVGILPVEFVKACHTENIEVVCIAVIPGVDPALKNLSDKYYEISAFKVEQVIRTCLDEKIDEVTMIGKVTKEWLFKNHVLPDWRTIKLLNRLRKANCQTTIDSRCLFLIRNCSSSTRKQWLKGLKSNQD